MTYLRLSSGDPDRLGAHPDSDGTDFAVFSEHATAIEVCLFDAGGRETVRVSLPERTGHVWHGRLEGVVAGQRYGLRAHGPFAPEAGHRFNPAKLLIDPYARRLTGRVGWHPSILGYDPQAGGDADLTLCAEDSAPHMPHCVVEAPLPPAPSGPRTPMAASVIYEAHAKGLTMRMPGVQAPGTLVALGSERLLDHLADLGVTALELLPLQAFVDDGFLVERGLVNYWGYQPIAWCAPEPRYLAGGTLQEVRDLVAAAHARGIEVLLDVVYNHTGEGGALGPTLSLRGLDNASYYRLAEGGRHYIDDTGCGNTLNIDHPMVLRLVMDSLRLWVTEYGIDGFRFDLAATLGRRGQEGFDPNGPFLSAVRQDPVLRQVKLIAEPWDIGPGGYQLGAFPHPFAEWNDRFRDGARRFWRGDAGEAADIAARFTGSALQFDHSGRCATSSVNFVTAHDGFTLMDVVSYARKHNEANREANRDGHNADYSDNHGVEGPSDSPDVRAARARTRRNLMATLLLSQGTPMILAGDEIGNSQGGNNNAYCQDGPIGWVDWEKADPEFLDFTRRMIAFRKAHPILRQRLFLHSQVRDLDDLPDLYWWHPEGRAMTPEDWEAESLAIVCAELRMASDTPEWAMLEAALFVVLNAGDAVDVALPNAPEGLRWRWALDTESADARPARPEVDANRVSVAGRSVAVFELAPA
ncbi:MAG: glycogen debranching protein GlgX [Alkalilacustris sp.]